MDGKKSIAGGFVEIGHEIKSFGTARVRVGVAWQNWLFYGSAGAAYARTKADISVLGFTTSAKTDRVGWAYGAGIEWKPMPHWSASFEWLRLDFGTDNVAFNLPIGGLVAGVPVDLDADIFRLNLNYRY